MAFSANNRLQKAFFDGTSRVTEAFPGLGAAAIDVIGRLSIGNPWLAAYGRRRSRRTIRAVRSFDRFLVIPDIHIGDAVMTQAALVALRDFFPQARIDYLVNKTAFPLIEGHPDATRVLPFFSDGSFISRPDLDALRGLVRRERYDLCVNFGPFVKNRDIVPGGGRILNIMDRSPDMLRNERDPHKINHFIWQFYWFVRELLSLRTPIRRRTDFRGVRLTIKAAAVDRARAFLARAGLPAGLPLILCNPDGASPYTRIHPLAFRELLRSLAGLEVRVLMNSGHTVAGIGERLRDSLPPGLRPRVTIIPPDMPVDAYAAIIDHCDAFVSGDTGPLHLAAARRYLFEGGAPFRNRTAVFSCFGATPARMSGYDSFQPGFLPANQDAPSWNTTAASPCRNISCVDKLFKTCRTVRCFERFDVAGLVDRIRSYLAARGPSPGS
ncbi:MAG: glycosyltransferase family 9 protein [Candidatus Aminicenantes bacterium]|nr:glycosyltransferase family 9 protein [Candidatus Aminicenantes bacterium]